MDHVILVWLGLTPIVLAWVACYSLCRELSARGKIVNDWRMTFLFANLLWGALLVFLVEMAGVFHALTPATLFSLWLCSSGILFCLARWLSSRRGAWTPWNLGRIAAWIRCDREAWPLEGKMFLAIAVLTMALLLGVAVMTPITNWDSLTYHLPRVMHWIQQSSVDHYPTGNTRQLEFGPWPAFAVLNLCLLQGNDSGANLVQWFFLLCLLIITTLIASQLLAILSRRKDLALGPQSAQRVCSLTVLLVVSLPIVMVEAITTQTDLVVAGWLAMAMALAMALYADPHNRWYLLALGLALGLGALAKVTLFIYAAPLIIALGLWYFIRSSQAGYHLNHLNGFLIVAAAFLALNAPHLWRNYSCFGSPLGSPDILAVGRNQEVSFAGTLSNLLRNLSLQTNTPIEPLTRLLNKGLAALHRLTGKSLNDPAITYHLGQFRWPKTFFVYDSYASCPLHLLLLFITAALILARPTKFRPLIVFGLLPLSSLLLFCSLLRWQQWHSRIHLAYFVLLMPAVAIVVVARFPRAIVAAVSVLVSGFGFFSLLQNQSKPLLSPEFMLATREQQYILLHGWPIHESLAKAALDLVISKCQVLGLKLRFDDPEYPIWVMLRNRGFTGRIEHVQVDNLSGRISRAGVAPGAVITAERLAQSLRRDYPHEMDYGLFKVYWSEAAGNWLHAIQFTGGRAKSFTPQDRELWFDQGAVHLALRTARPGIFRMTGKWVSPPEPSERKLRVTTNTGYAQEESVVSSKALCLAIPTHQGTTGIQLALINESTPSSAAIALEQIQWSWEPQAPEPRIPDN